MQNRPPKPLFKLSFAILTAFTLSAQAFAQTGQSIVETIRAMLERGNIYLAKQQFPQAIECYQKVLDQEPNNPYARSNMVLAHNNWGIFWFHKNNFEEAKKEWEETLKLDPNDRNARNNLLVLRRTVERMGKNYDDLGAEARAKEEEKKQAKAKANQPPSAVILSPQKTSGGIDSYDENDLKQADAPSGASIVSPQSPGAAQATPSGAVVQNASATQSGAVIQSSTAQTPSGAVIQSAPSQTPTQTPSGATISAPTSAAPSPPAQPQQPVSVSRTKAEDDLDAFRRLTTGGNTTGGATRPAATTPSSALPFTPSRPYTGGKPVFHASTGSPSFEDDSPAVQQQAPPAQAPANDIVQTPPQRAAAPPQREPVQNAHAEPSTALSDAEDKTHKRKKPAKQVAQVEPWHSPNEEPAPPANIDDLLNRIETKIYGSPRPQPSVLLRLERIETDSYGRPSSGSIAERILKLKQMYNLL